MADVALSISLTAIISLISIFSVPFIIFKSADLLGIQSLNIKKNFMIGISLKMFFVVTVPVFLGMLIRKFATNFIASKTKLIQKISIILFLIVFISIWIEEWSKIVSFITRAGLIAFTLNVLMMVLGYFLAKIFISGIEQRKCISLECGLQNGTLAVFVATQLVDDIVYIVPTVHML